MQNALKFEKYGKIIWLWSNSRIHKSWPTHLQSRFVLPAITRNQYHLLEEGSLPVAYCSWAFLDLETEKRYILNPNSLEPKNWNSGSRLWFVDYISPFSKRYTWKLKSELAKIFPDHVGRSIRIWDDRDKARVSHYKGVNLPSEEYRRTRSGYFKEIHEIMQSDLNVENQVQVVPG